MTMKKNGELVIVFESVNQNVIMVEGLGIYCGKIPVLVTSSDGGALELHTPEIRMLDGRTLYGFECWWIAVRTGRPLIGEREVGLLGARP